jgi:uncharacterized glyoxalase superfamily protein PhnB
MTTDSRSATLEAQALGASLTVSDLASSRAWYVDTLGFTVTREHAREGQLFAVSLAAGAVQVLLTQDNGAKGSDRVRGEGFSLQLTTSQDIDAIAARATRTGAALDTPPSDAFGVRMFRLRDPDGFRWTISSPRAG